MKNTMYPKVQIAISLVNESRLAVRSGEQVDLELPSQGTESKDKQPTLAQLRLDARGYPVLPGSSLKGMLRALCDDTLAETLFGGQRQCTPQSGEGPKYLRLNGCVTVQGATALPDFVVSDSVVNDTHASIDEVTGTAKDNHLFSQAWIEPQTQFDWQLHCEFITHGQLEQLLSILSNARLQLGAGQKFGYGALTAAIPKQDGKLKVRVLTQEKLSEWLACQAPQPLDNFYTEQLIAPGKDPQQKSQPVKLCFTLALTSPDPVLVASPAYLSRLTEEQKASNSKDKLKNLYFSRDNDGQPVIPASALRGMLRARFIKIIRTLNAEIDEKTLQSLWAAIWGDSGKRSALIIRDARMAADARHAKHHQSMIAIDRFTGGVKDGALFEVEAFTLQGALHAQCEINHEALLRNPMATAVLVLVLKDLFEQKLTIGASKNRGFGRLGGNVLVNGKPLHSSRDFIQRCLTPLNITQETLLNALGELKALTSQELAHDE
ncbi:RAMP superfamily CRISPR-associated protein [Pseudoalteromonas viridis]|uniref:CRISPR type III-associated protein domain-containing protein n=1 Tax=Pseudoalteromonas viridis TaxID=339617 RepID=A0ABX7VC15_9GAMM|nr:RAMP superfamily CRISPR-associated protein [Pseudoalteromonas viridis]QTL37337.1 hypothetical protein J5X90_21040 [Pseudoalteromonas viridis]